MLCAVLLVSVAVPTVTRAASVQDTWGVGPGPFGLSIDAVSGRVFVPITGKWLGSFGNLAVANPATGVIDWVPLESSADLSAFDPGSRRVFTTTADGTLVIVDADSLNVVDLVPDAGSLGVAVDPQTHHVFASTLHALVMTDGATGTVLARMTAPPGETWWDVAFDPSSDRVYLTNNADGTSGSLVVLKASDLSLIADIALPRSPRWGLAVDAADQLVYVAGYQVGGGIHVVDATSLQVARSVFTEDFPLWLTIDPIGERLFVSVTGTLNFPTQQAIQVLDRVSLRETLRVHFPWQPGPSVLGPDGRLYVSAANSSRLAAIQFANSAPVIDNLTFTPSSPVTSDVLHASVSAHDPDGDAYTLAYQWSRNGAVIANATGSSLDLGVPGNGDRGDVITVSVVATDGQSSSAQSASVAIGDALPALTVSLSPNPPKTDDVIVATASVSDADGDSVSMAYAWTRNGVPIAGANAASLDLGQYANRDDIVAVSVSADDGHGGVANTTVATTVADSPPVVQLTTTPGAPKTNDTIVANVVVSDPDGDRIGCCSWTLKRNGTVVFGVSAGTYMTFDLSQPGWGDRGDTITVEVAAGDGTLGTVARTSVVVVNSAPVGGVVLSNYSPTKKDTLVAYGSVFDADGDTGILMTYTWKVGQKVKLVVGPTSATTSSFDLRQLQSGDIVTVTVTPTSDGYELGVPASATAVLTSH